LLTHIICYVFLYDLFTCFSFFQNLFSQTSSSTSSKLCYMSHILMKKYALISIAYKFLDIGIIVGSISHVQIAISDNRSNDMFYLYATWKTFIKRRVDIERLMQSTFSSSPIQDLNVELVKIYDTNNVKLTLNGTCLYMTPTMLFLFEFEHMNMYSMNRVNIRTI